MNNSDWPEMKGFIKREKATYSYIQKGSAYIVSTQMNGLVLQCAICEEDDPDWYSDFVTNFLKL